MPTIVVCCSKYHGSHGIGHTKAVPRGLLAADWTELGEFLKPNFVLLYCNDDTPREVCDTCVQHYYPTAAGCTAGCAPAP